MKVLALDYGSARTGVAVSDPTGTLARPLGVVRRFARRDGFERLHRRDPASRQPEEIVVGLPLTLRGEHGLQAARDGRVRRGAARARSTIPVETYDERFTSSLAGGDDARAAAHLLESYLEWRSNPLTTRRAVIRRRRIVAVTLAVLVVGAAGAVAGWGVTRETAAPTAPATTAPPPPPKPFRIVFPEGFTREEMADRVVAVAEIARRKRNANVRLEPHRVPRRERARHRARASAASRRRTSRASSSRRPTTSCATRPRGSSSPTRSRRSAATGGRSTCATRARRT